MTAAMVLLGATARAEFGDPVGGLTIDELARFTAGRDTFEEVETVADGLGPVFNGDSCAACHNVGGTGGGSTPNRSSVSAATVRNSSPSRAVAMRR